METPIEVLRIEQNIVSKELNRFRACDSNSRCFYCREWAQYIYKKHFVWNAKTQEDIYADQYHSSSMSTGHYSICMLQTPSESKRKERSPKLSEQFEKLLEAKTNMEEQEEDNNGVEEDEEEDNDTNDENEPTTSLKYKDNKGNDKKKNKKEQQNKMTATEPSTTLTQDIIQACILWQSLPSSLSGLPSIFEPVQFNPFPDHIPLDDDLKAPAQLLDPLIIERQALCLPSEGFHLLKNLTGDILLSHTQPSCHHVKPDDPSPTDLELERQVLNDDLQTITNQVLAVMDKRLMASWKPLLDFLYQLEHLEEQRDTLMGKQCQATVDAFVEKQQLIPFTQYWQQFISRHNNKKKNQVNEEALYHMINTYLDTLVQHVQSFLDDFVKPRLEQIGQLIQNLWDLVGPTIQHMAERMATHEERDKGNAENCRAVSQSLKGLHSSKEVDEAIDRIQHAMADRVNEYINSVQQLKQSYISIPDSSSSSPSAAKSALFEKFTQKDFKKKVKKLETGYTSLRQFFRYEVSQKIFPETLFCKFSLVCLGALMQEGEVMEAMIIETEVKRFIETHRLLVKRRQAIILQYEEGVQVGRRELAGILGKLFLKEGMRIQGENLALKRQNMLLKSMGVNDSNNGHKSASDTTSKKKKKNKKNKNKSVTATPIDSQKEKEQYHTIEDSEIKSQDKVDDDTTTIIQSDPQPKQQTDQEQVILSTSTSTSSSATITTPSSPLQLPPPLPTTITSQKQKLEPPTVKKKNKVLVIPASTPITSPSTSSTEEAVPNMKERTVPHKPNISAKTKTVKIASSKPTTTQPVPSKNSINSSTITTKSTTSEVTDDIPDRKSKDIGINTTGKTLDANEHINNERNKVDDSSKEVNNHTPSPLNSVTSNDIIKATDNSHIIEENEEKEQQIQKHADMIKQLQQDKQELETKIMTLQQEMVNMEQHYAEKLKQQQQQAWQLYEQQQKENKELHRYVQQLESQIKLTSQQPALPIKNNTSNGILPTINSTPSSLTSSSNPLGSSHIYNHNFYQQSSLNSSSSHWLSTGFGNQDLFAGYRQEMQSSTPTSFHPPAL
ncbi:hypothetical protein BJ944DRAFT_268976 [Cunninghamella echinulata]|nr:hypothetical protein BJ944DRAFT_268976 [Cunninghamella echinulata]